MSNQATSVDKTLFCLLNFFMPGSGSISDQVKYLLYLYLIILWSLRDFYFWLFYVTKHGCYNLVFDNEWILVSWSSPSTGFFLLHKNMLGLPWFQVHWTFPPQGWLKFNFWCCSLYWLYFYSWCAVIVRNSWGSFSGLK